MVNLRKMILDGGDVMRLIRVGIILSICMPVLFGCSGAIQKDPVHSHSNEVMSLVDEFEWNKAKRGAEDLEQLFKKNKWKYQLLGTDTEDMGLDRHIKKLQISIEEKDKEEAKKDTAMIKHYIESMYFNEVIKVGHGSCPNDDY